MKKLFVLVILLSSFLLYAEEISNVPNENESIGIVNNGSTVTQTEIENKTDKNRNLLKNTSNAVLEKFYNEKTGNTETNKWNTKDFQNHFDKQGTGVGVIGNLKTFMGNDEVFKRGMEADPNASNTNAIMQDETLKSTPVMKNLSGNIQESLIANTTSLNSNSSISLENTVKCYITRDIPMRFQCTKTGIMYGGGVNEDGLRARTECKSECYEQFNCVTVKEDDTTLQEGISDIQITVRAQNQPTETKVDNIINGNSTYILNQPKRVNTLNFYIESSLQKSRAKFTLKALTWKNLTVTLIDRFYIENLKSNQTIKINDNIKEIYFEISNGDFNEILTIKDIKVNYSKDNRYICPKQQDIKNLTEDNYSHLCPSGNFVEFNVFESSYKICADYGIRGSNSDGTYATLDECNSICKQEHECVLNTTTFSTDILKNFREGCIQGQTNCEPDTCKNLRLAGNKILNENIFDANSTLTQSIINSVQVQGVDRPKVLLSEDIDFQERSQEEWKDEAYKYMVNNENFRISKNTLSENTQEDSSYGLSINTNNVLNGYSTVPIRGLVWNYKPKASDVNTGKQFKFYVVLEIIAERYVITGSRKKQKIKDKILYVKTQDSDSFKPFAVKMNYATNAVVSDLQEQIDFTTAENETAQWEYKSFNNTTKKWYSHSSGLLLESYKIHNMQLSTPFIREFAINNLANMIYSLPGLVRGIENNGPYETILYDGKFLGNGHAVGKYTVYAFNGRDNAFTYQDIVEKITNKEIKPIYDNLQSPIYKQNLLDDSGSLETDTDIFTYGPIEKKTAFVRMKPKTEDVGKKAFIFIFGY